MIEIVGTALNQWDTGRVVHITGIEAEYAHFANKGDSKAVIMGIVDNEAKIPDYLLQTGKQLCVYAVKDGITLESKTFSVRNRERPENYVYEDDQRNYIYELITSAEIAIEGASRAVEEANLALASANTAAGKVNAAVENAIKSADSANEAAKSANEAAAKAAHTAKNLMVIGGAEGENISLDDAIEQYLVGLRVFGKSTQAGTPTPDAPVDIVSAGDGSITVNVAGDNEVQSMTIATPNGLPGIPVASGGNYTDANGQQWVCDEVDFCRGVYVQRVDAREITENPSIGVSAYGDAGYYRFVIYDIDTAAGEVTPCMCSHFDDKYQWDRNEEYCYVTGYSSKAYVFSNRWATTSEFAAWLKAQEDAGTPLTFIYVRTYPIETPLSAEELAAYAALHTYRGNTVVSNDAGAYMDLEYVMDAKKYIDSLLAGGSPATILEATVE